MACGQMRRYADNLNVTIGSALLPAGMTGFYDEAIRTILLTGGSSTGGMPTPPSKSTRATSPYPIRTGRAAKHGANPNRHDHRTEQLIACW